MQSPFRLDNRIALITGGSSGIGEATARAFNRAGASVIILSIDQAQAAEREAGQDGGSADLAVYLASDESGFTIGAALPIDGGWTAA